MWISFLDLVSHLFGDVLMKIFHVPSQIPTNTRSIFNQDSVRLHAASVWVDKPASEGKASGTLGE